MLRVENLYKSFGGLIALKDVSLHVERGSITGLIGPNGSGKTTLFNVVSGLYLRDSGRIYFKNERIEDLPAYHIAGKGLMRTFQITVMPKRMTVMENILTSPFGQIGEGVLRVFLTPRAIRRQEEFNLEKGLGLLRDLELLDLKDEYAGNLSGGQQKLLSLARALMAEPDMLLLDEPTAGVNPTLTVKILDYLRRLRLQGKTLVIVEHDMKVISTLCDVVYVLNNGEVIAVGSPAELQRDERVIEAYLGRKANVHADG